MSNGYAQRVTIALCTYNGAQHLEAQLASYLSQTYAGWDLWISDDGSSDATRAVLHAFAKSHGSGRDIRIIDGPQAGVATNFMSLLCHPEFPKGPCALSDQDDIWLPEKLALGMHEMGGDIPCIYGAQSVHTDASLKPIGRSLGGGKASFGNALVQNIISGHSTLLNASALALVRTAGVPVGVPYHDWWLYQLITGTGGRVVLRRDAVLLYRQHGANALGSRQGFRASLRRAAQVLGQTYGGWISANVVALRRIEKYLTPEARNTLAELSSAQPRLGALARLRIFRRHGVARQDRRSTMLLYVAILLGRI